MKKTFALLALAGLNLAACTEGGSNAPQDAKVTVGSSNPPAAAGDPAPAFHCMSPIVSTAVEPAFSPGCESCGVRNARDAADAHASSFASMDFTIPAGESAALRVTAPAGTTWSAGTHPGVMARFPDGDRSEVTYLIFRIRTYLGGVLQDESPVPTSIRSGGMDEDKTFYYADATRPYDAVEFYAETLSGVATYRSAQVFEMCWNDDLAR